MAVYRLSVDYTLGDQVVGPSGKVAFIPSVKLVDATGAASPSGASNAPLYINPAKETTATLTAPVATAATTSILAANTNRLPGSTITNDSTSIMYVLLGSGTASATNYTVAIDGKSSVPGVYFLPDGWTGAVQGIWVTATGNARVTELSA